MNQKILTNPTRNDWLVIEGQAEDRDGATLVGPGWTAKGFPGYILIRGETGPVNALYAELCK